MKIKRKVDIQRISTSKKCSAEAGARLPHIAVNLLVILSSFFVLVFKSTYIYVSALYFLLHFDTIISSSFTIPPSVVCKSLLYSA